MMYSFDGQSYIVRVNRGDRLHAALEQFVAETKLQAGWVSGLGGAQEVTLGFYDPDKQAYLWQTFTGLRELTGLQGNIAADETGALAVHLHGTLADRQYQIIGGHVKDLVAGATVELCIRPFAQALKRRQEPAVGLALLELQ